MNTLDKKYKKNTLKAKVKEAMEKILPDYPKGIYATKLGKLILKLYPNISQHEHSIVAAISNVTRDCPQKFQKKRKGGHMFYFLAENAPPSHSLGGSEASSVETVKAKVKKAMEKILPEHPNGIRAMELGKLISKSYPNISQHEHSIVAAISNVTRDCPQKFRKEKIQGEGTFYYSVESASGREEPPLTPPPPKSSHRKEYKEEDFYGPFAEFLQYSDDDERLDECTKAIPLGGNKFGKFWQTPDVIGLLETRRGNIVEFPTQVISAEIKIDDSSQALMTAFGQACAYRLFSHKTYLVVPESADIKLLKQICHLLGIGLVCFNSKVKELDTSIFKIKLVAQRYEPDMFYVNQYLGKIAKELE